jgi:hypothetical protein
MHFKLTLWLRRPRHRPAEGQVHLARCGRNLACRRTSKSTANAVIPLENFRWTGKAGAGVWIGAVKVLIQSLQMLNQKAK